MLCVTATPTGLDTIIRTPGNIQTCVLWKLQVFLSFCPHLHQSINTWSNNQRASCPAAQQEVPQYSKLLQYSSTPTTNSLAWTDPICTVLVRFECLTVNMKVSQSSAHCSLIFINHLRKFKLMDRRSGHWWDTETEVDFNLLLWWKCRCLQFTDGDRGDRPSSWSSLTGLAWRPLKHTRKKRSHDQTLVNTVTRI